MHAWSQICNNIIWLLHTAAVKIIRSVLITHHTFCSAVVYIELTLTSQYHKQIGIMSRPFRMFMLSVVILTCTHIGASEKDGESLK